VISDARARPQEDDAMTASSPDDTPDTVTAHAGGAAVRDETAVDAAAQKAPGRRGPKASRTDDGDDGGTRARPSLPLVPVLTVLLVLLLAGVGFLWFTRPGASAVRTADYVQALQAARSGVVDMTSFDYLTLDDDIKQIQAVTTGDLKKEAVDQLNGRRQQITDTQATVNTEVVGAGVTKADATDATVLLVIQSTQKSTASEQAQVVRYRIQVELQKKADRWLLSGIAGTGTGGNG
jgi:Mce-associated membrane protein